MEWQRTVRQVVGSTFQQLEAPSPRSYLGSGKVQEIVEAVQATGAVTVIADDELSPVSPVLSHSMMQRLNWCKPEEQTPDTVLTQLSSSFLWSAALAGIRTFMSLETATSDMPGSSAVACPAGPAAHPDAHL
jgi:GTP-binding GTPase N-terminal